MRAILIGGLPGSGKTTLAKKLLEENPDLILFDDLSLYSDPFSALTGLTGDFIITDPYLCREDDRNTLEQHLYSEYPDIIFSYIMFKNEPNICLENVAFRQDGRKVKTFIEILSRRYTVPEDAQILDVVSTLEPNLTKIK